MLLFSYEISIYPKTQTNCNLLVLLFIIFYEYSLLYCIRVNILKGLVARNAFKLKFNELHRYFFLFNSLNYIYRTYICCFKKIPS